MKSAQTVLLSLSAAVILAAAALIPTPAIAQDEEASRYALDEVVVTARRREEGLQDAPLAITAMSGADLENRGALDVADFADAAPNVSFKAEGNISGVSFAPRISIRGIGQSDFVINTDPAVGIYADGVYLGRSLGSILDLLDVERVEALRGPQGTLFGRNSTGGAINIIAVKPSVEDGSSGTVSAEAGENGYYVLRGNANLVLGDSAAARVSAFKRERDGFVPALQYENLDLGAEDVWGLRAAIRFQPTDALSIDIDADISERNDSPAPNYAARLGDLSVGESGLDQVFPRVGGESTSIMSRVFNGEPFGPVAPPPVQQWVSTDPLCGTNGQAYRDATAACSGNYWAGSRDGSNMVWWDLDGNKVRPEQKFDSYGYAARLQWDLGSVQLNSISSWRGFDSSFMNGSPNPVITTANNNDVFEQDQFTQELQLSGSGFNEKLDWHVGAYYMSEDGYEQVKVVIPYIPPSYGNDADFLPLSNIQNRYIDNTSKAIFGQGIIHMTDAWTLTLGVRRTEDEKKARFVLFNDNFVDETIFLGYQAAEETNILVNLAWNINDSVMIYGQFSDGFRDGGFPSRIDPAAVELALYDPEFVESIEFGLKSTSSNGRFRANVAVFEMSYKDMQVGATLTSPVPGVIAPSVDNLGDSSLTGVEFEGSLLATDNLRFDLSVGYLQNDIDSLVGGGLVINRGNNLQKIVTTANSLPFAPELQLDFGINYSAGLGNGGEIRTRFDYIYEADQYTAIANYAQTYLPSTYRINANASYIPADANWEIMVAVRNLTDEEDITSTDLNTGLGNALFHIPARGREAFIRYKHSFGGN